MQVAYIRQRKDSAYFYYLHNVNFSFFMRITLLFLICLVASGLYSGAQTASSVKLNPLPEDLQAWKRYEPTLKFSGLRVTAEGIIFNAGKYRDAAQFFREKLDGMIAEIVPFTPYACPAGQAFTEPSRRNGRKAFNGIPVVPVYRSKILRLNEQGRSTYKPNDLVYVNLGNLPAGIPDLREINILFLKNNRICGIVSFHHLRDTMFRYYPRIPYVPIPPPELCTCYQPPEKLQTVSFRFYYAVNETIPDAQMIRRVQGFLRDNYTGISRISVTSYASIEGNYPINYRLFLSRASVLSDSMRKHVPSKVNFSIQASENWGMFRQQIQDPSLAFLQNLDTSRVRDYMNENALGSMRPLLDAQRYSEVMIYFFPSVPIETIHRQAIAEYLILFRKYRLQYQKQPDISLPKNSLRKMSDILDYLLLEVQSDRLSGQAVDTLPLLTNMDVLKQPLMPGLSMVKDPFSSLAAKKIWFDLHYRSEEFNEEQKFRFLLLLCGTEGAPPEAEYNLQALLINSAMLKTPSDFSFYSSPERVFRLSTLTGAKLPENGLEQMRLFAHFEKINQTVRKGYEKYGEATASLRYIYQYFKTNAPSAGFRIDLARLFMTFLAYDYATGILAPLISPEVTDYEAYSLWLKIFYVKNGVRDLKPELYEPLFKAASVLSPSSFCKLFEEEERINFQILDYKPLWDLYCKNYSK